MILAGLSKPVELRYYWLLAIQFHTQSPFIPLAVWRAVWRIWALQSPRSHI